MGWAGRPHLRKDAAEATKGRKGVVFRQDVVLAVGALNKSLQEEVRHPHSLARRRSPRHSRSARAHRVNNARLDSAARARTSVALASPRPNFRTGPGCKGEPDGRSLERTVPAGAAIRAWSQKLTRSAAGGWYFAPAPPSLVLLPVARQQACNKHKPASSPAIHGRGSIPRLSSARLATHSRWGAAAAAAASHHLLAGPWPARPLADTSCPQLRILLVYLLY